MKNTLPKTRPVQDTPEALVSRLVGVIRGQFCGDISDADWYKSHQQFIRVKVVLWPARFMAGKGFTLPGDRYLEIMLKILDGIKRHGATSQVRYWPGYLLGCVQSHWRHHWEGYYEESKSVQNIVSAALLAGRISRPDPTVEVLAIAHRVLTSKKTASKSSSTRLQMSFLSL